MSSMLDTYNASILAIPAYYFLSVWPHAYAIIVASQGKLDTWVLLPYIPFRVELWLTHTSLRTTAIRAAATSKPN